MKAYRRFTEAERAEIWKRIEAGESMRSVAIAFGCFHNAVRRMVQQTGGAMPALRRVRATALTLAEREEISRGLAARDSCRGIAARLGRAPSTVAREVERTGGGARYRAHSGERRALRQARRPKPAKLAVRPGLRSVVEAKWSAAEVREG